MRTLVALLCLLLALAADPVCAAPNERRVALVIGNSAYERFPALPNPRNDAEDVIAALKKAGFEVLGGTDLTRDAMRDQLRRFARAAQGADAALAYYAGHGLQYKGRNYIVPVDAKLQDEFDLEYETVRVDDVVGELGRADGARILVLDACRNLPLKEKSERNPFSETGLAKISGRGLVVAYATQANALAYDGVGRNSIFTEAFLKVIDEPSLDLPQFFQRVSIAVDKKSDGRQTPELSLSYPGQFFFNRSETDRDVWRRIREATDPAVFRDFLQKFPSSDLADAASSRLARLDDWNALKQEQARRAEAAKAKREEQERAEAARQKKLAEERAAAERRLAEERRVAEERRLAEEARVAEDARQKRLAEERAAEARRVAELARAAEDARQKKLAEERAAEAKRLAEQERAAEDARQKRLAEERAAETRRLAELARAAEDARQKQIAEEKAAEARRVAEQERTAEEARQTRLAEERAAEARRAAELARAAEDARQKQIAEEKAAEARRVAERERAAEESRQKRLAEEKATEARRLAEQARAADEARRAQLAADEAAEARRVADQATLAEDNTRQAKLAEERAAEARRLVERDRAEEEARRAALAADEPAPSAAAPIGRLAALDTGSRPSEDEGPTEGPARAIGIGESRMAYNEARPTTPDAGPPASAFPAETIARDTLHLQTETELGRIGCLDEMADKDWTAKSRTALEHFARQAKLKPVPTAPTADLLEDLKRRPAHFCPLACGPGTRARGDACVAIEKPAPQPVARKPKAEPVVVEKEWPKARREVNRPTPRESVQERPKPHREAVQPRQRPAPVAAAPRPAAAPPQAPVSTAARPMQRPLMGVGF